MCDVGGNLIKGQSTLPRTVDFCNCDFANKFEAHYRINYKQKIKADYIV